MRNSMIQTIEETVRFAASYSGKCGRGATESERLAKCQYEKQMLI